MSFKTVPRVLDDRRNSSVCYVDPSAKFSTRCVSVDTSEFRLPGKRLVPDTVDPETLIAGTHAIDEDFFSCWRKILKELNVSCFAQKGQKLSFIIFEHCNLYLLSHYASVVSTMSYSSLISTPWISVPGGRSFTCQ